MTCRADPPGWKRDEDGEPWWYAGGPNYGEPCVPARGAYDGEPRYSCAFCGQELPGT